MTTALPTFWIVIVGQQEVGRGERVEIRSSFLLVSTLCGQIGSVQDRSPTCPRAFIHSFRTGVPLVGCGVYGGAQGSQPRWMHGISEGRAVAVEDHQPEAPAPGPGATAPNAPATEADAPAPEAGAPAPEAAGPGAPDTDAVGAAGSVPRGADSI